MSLEQKTRTKNNKTTRRNFLKKTLTTITSIILAAYIGISNPACNTNPLGPQPPTEQQTANLKGTITGMFTNKNITQGEISLLTSWTTTPKYTTQIKNGEFQINNIEYPGRYTRIRIKSPEIINRETNIKLGTGENQAEITVIEEDKTTGYHYEDYLTINCEGYRMTKDIAYKAYFYNQTVWKAENNQLVKAKKISPHYTAKILPMIKDILKNDLPRITKGHYQHKGLLLESNGDQGPGIPSVYDKKKGWLIIYLVENQGAPAYTSTFVDEKHNIISASMSINYYAGINQITNFRRRGLCQDICAWAGFVDRLQKNNISIFADDDHGYKVPDYPTNFDINYAAEIKYNRLPGHKARKDLDIPDYDSSHTSNGNGVYIKNYNTPLTNHNPWQNTPFELLQTPTQNPWPITPRQQKTQKTRTRKHK